MWRRNKVSDERLDFNTLIKRTPGSGRREPIQSEFWQCIVFFGKPVTEEISEITELNKMTGFLNRKKSRALMDIINTKRFIFPYYSKELFGSAEDASKYMSTYIKELINKGELPVQSINKDGSINEDLIMCSIHQLEPTIIERDLPEFKGF